MAVGRVQQVLCGGKSQRQRGQTNNESARPCSTAAPSRQLQSAGGGNAMVMMDHDATVLLSQSTGTPPTRQASRKQEAALGDLTLLRAAANRRVTATVVTSLGSKGGQLVPPESEDGTSTSVLREVHEGEMEYIPNRLPSRSGGRAKNAWRSMKEKEVRVLQNSMAVEDHSQRHRAQVDSRVQQGHFKHHVKTARTKVDSPLSVIGSHDSFVQKPTRSPSSNLQSSETNLLFRTNTNFFNRNGAGRVVSNVQAGVCVSDEHMDCNREEKEKIKWRLSSRISPDPGRLGSKTALDLNLVKEKLKDAHLIDEDDSDSDYLDDDFSEDGRRQGVKNDIMSCLIIQKSPRVKLSEDKTPRKTGTEKDKPGRGRGRGRQARGNAFKRGSQGKSPHLPVGADVVPGGGRGAPVFLSTSFLQSALCPSPGDEPGERRPGPEKTEPSVGMPPADDGSVVVWAGTASQLSSRQGPRRDEGWVGQQNGVSLTPRTAVTFGVSGNKRDGQWSNPSAVPAMAVGASDRKHTACPVVKPQKDNVKAAPGIRTVSGTREVTHVTKNLTESSWSKDERDKLNSNQCVTTKDTSFNDMTDQKNDKSKDTIIGIARSEASDEWDIGNTSFSSDLSCDMLAPFDHEDTQGDILNASGDKNFITRKFSFGGDKNEAVRSKTLPESGVSDGGDVLSSQDRDVQQHGETNNAHGDEDCQTRLPPEHPDMDTDEEIESGLGLTSLHNCYYGKPNTMSACDEGCCSDGTTQSVNQCLAVLGTPGDHRLNPAWEWLYSFPHTFQVGADNAPFNSELDVEGNANNNSNVVDGYFERGTSLYVRPEEDLYAGDTEVCGPQGYNDLCSKIQHKIWAGF